MFNHVECCKCHVKYRCTATQDYYHKPDQEDRTSTNGYCFNCLVNTPKKVDGVITIRRKINPNLN